MAANTLLAQLSAEALKKVTGTELEHDKAKLEQLAEIALDEQALVVHCHFRLDVPWETALEGRTRRSSANAGSPTKAPPTTEPAQHRASQVQLRKLDQLKPNRFNRALFPDSLTEESIAVIAEDLAKNGQRVPIEVTPDGVIVDGERRWRGAKALGWDAADVVVTGKLTDDEILDRVIDACTSTRRMSVREQVNVYNALHERLKREAGKPQGRPSKKTMPDGIVFLTPRDMQDAAARRAGFASGKAAIRASAVFSRGTVELQGQVLDGSLTISAAYDQLPKRPKKGAGSDDGSGPAPAITGSACNEPKVVADSEPDGAQSTPRAQPPGSIAVLAPVGNLAASASEDQADVEEGSGDDDYDLGAVSDDGDPTDLFLDSFISAGDDRADVERHVGALRRHVARLAELDYTGAATWLEQVFEELRGALGEPPELYESGDGSNGEALWDS